MEIVKELNLSESWPWLLFGAIWIGGTFYWTLQKCRQVEKGVEESRKEHSAWLASLSDEDKGLYEIIRRASRGL